MKRTNLFKIFFTALSLVLLLINATACSSTPQTKTEINMVIAPYSSEWFTTYAIRNNIITSEEVEFNITSNIRFNDQMLAGDFIMGEMSVSTFAIAIENNQSPYRAISTFITQKGIEDARGINVLFARADSDINSPEDLAGKRIGVPGLQSSAATIFLVMLERQYGITEDQLTLVDKSSPLLIELLRQGELDATILIGNPPPQAYYDPDFKTVWNLDEAFYEEHGEYYSPTVLLVDSNFYDNNKKAAETAYELLKESSAYAREHLDDLAEEYAVEFGADLPADFYLTAQRYHATATLSPIEGDMEDAVMAIFELVQERNIISEIPDPDVAFVKW